MHAGQHPSLEPLTALCVGNFITVLQRFETKARPAVGGSDRALAHSGGRGARGANARRRLVFGSDVAGGLRPRRLTGAAPKVQQPTVGREPYSVGWSPWGPPGLWNLVGPPIMPKKARGGEPAWAWLMDGHGWLICLGHRSRMDRTKLLHAGRSAGSVERATGMQLAGFAMLSVSASWHQ